ncbi:MAG: hypothetical protein OXP66_02270 [Candidatus Tectomicrobia bacterium]|nr:hypothetical protein [Candidatus Tectomicrobia bacterium]
MAFVLRLVMGMFVAALATAPVEGQEGSDAWLDGELLMLTVLNSEALDGQVFEHFHPDCRIALDGVMARHITLAGNNTVPGSPPCRGGRHWDGVRRYVREFRARNDTAGRFMRPSGIGAPWMVRYAVRCRQACRGDTVGFEIRFTYDGQRVTRVELQAR